MDPRAADKGDRAIAFGRDGGFLANAFASVGIAGETSQHCIDARNGIAAARANGRRR